MGGTGRPGDGMVTTGPFAYDNGWVLNISVVPVGPENPAVNGHYTREGGGATPARQFGPALMGGGVPVWPYLLGPVAGSLLVAGTVRALAGLLREGGPPPAPVRTAAAAPRAARRRTPSGPGRGGVPDGPASRGRPRR
jgi:hypothetical protein